EIEVPLYLGDDRLKHRCKNCDPSTDVEKYEWSEEYSQWTYLHSIKKCPTCDSLLEVPGYNEEVYDIALLCMNCDPSNKRYKYSWDPEDKEWYPKFVTYLCVECEKPVKTVYTYEYDPNLKFYCHKHMSLESGDSTPLHS